MPTTRLAWFFRETWIAASVSVTTLWLTKQHIPFWLPATIFVLSIVNGVEIKRSQWGKEHPGQFVGALLVAVVILLMMVRLHL